jgi:hypothetical protein
MKLRPFTVPVVAAGLLWVSAAPVRAQSSEPPPRPFLRKVIQLDDQKLAAIDKGEKVRDGFETAMKETVKVARDRLASAAK